MYSSQRENTITKSIFKNQYKNTEVIEDILPSDFPDTDFSTAESQSKLKLMNKLLDFFSTPTDFLQFRKICELEEFYATLEEKPKEALLCMSAAVHTVLIDKWGKDTLKDHAKINIRLHNHPELFISLKNLKAAYIDRLVSVRGTVVKVSNVRPLVVIMEFSCTKCRTNITQYFPDGKFTPPSKCKMIGCKSKTFIPGRSTAQLLDFQKIRLQELLKSEHHEQGRVPRSLNRYSGA